RVIPIGPKAQSLIREFFTDDPADYLLSPRRAVIEFHAVRSAARKTPRYPSHMARNAAKRPADPKPQPAERYTLDAYAQAVERAVGRANAARAKEQAEDGAVRSAIAVWTPNQLRHLSATEVRKRFGLEAAQVVLGHEKASTTEIYAEKNISLAVRV